MQAPAGIELRVVIVAGFVLSHCEGYALGRSGGFANYQLCFQIVVGASPAFQAQHLVEGLKGDRPNCSRGTRMVVREGVSGSE